MASRLRSRAACKSNFSLLFQSAPQLHPGISAALCASDFRVSQAFRMLHSTSKVFGEFIGLRLHHHRHRP